MSDATVRVPKEERLLNLLAALRASERGMAKSDVRRLVAGYGGQNDEAFERMFERDKDSLRALNVPLLTTVSPVHQTDIVYRVAGDPDGVAELSLSAEESAVLAAAAGVWRDASLASPARRGLTKLRGLAADGAGPSGESLLGTGVGLAETGPAFSVILGALEEGQAVRFSYRAASTGELSTRVVDPWRLAARGRSWYLVGHDHERDDVRVFHLGRIRGRARAVEAGHRVPAPDDLDVGAVLSSSSGRRVDAALALAPGRGGALRTHGRVVEPAAGVPDGWDTLALTTTDLEGLAGDVSAVGDAALALDPDDLVDAVRRRLTHLVGLPVADAGAPPAGAKRPAPRTASPRREVAEDRLARLLALVLRLDEHGDATVDDLAAHFGVTPEQIVADVNLLWVTGLPGYQHDDLIDFSVPAFESGVVSLANDQGLARPLRLATDEAVLLLVALGPLRSVAEGAQLSTRLVDSLAAKLEAAAGSATNVARAVDVAAPGADPETLTRAREALRTGSRLHLTYVSGADVLTERDVDPRSLVLDAGDWLLSAWCLRAGAPRTFRIDRVLSAEVLDVPAAEHPWPERTDQVGDVGEVVVVDVVSMARPFAERVPSIATEDLDDGGVRVWLRVADEGWFVAEMLDLGDDVVALGPPAWTERVRHAAAAALARYSG
ncbi:MAG: helix-turn-helix transcriptional regulator [Actinomycetaceae bacterium]